MIIWTAFQLGELFHLDGVSQIITQTIEQIQTELLMRDFTTAETQRDLALLSPSARNRRILRSLML